MWRNGVTDERTNNPTSNVHEYVVSIFVAKQISNDCVEWITNALIQNSTKFYLNQIFT